jgi:hypothetical protein
MKTAPTICALVGSFALGMVAQSQIHKAQTRVGPQVPNHYSFASTVQALEAKPGFLHIFPKPSGPFYFTRANNEVEVGAYGGDQIRIYQLGERGEDNIHIISHGDELGFNANDLFARAGEQMRFGENITDQDRRIYQRILGYTNEALGR